MKITELGEEEILNFLMTNDLEDNYSPSELKYLISKWRYFYRLSLAKNEQLGYSYENKIIALDSEIKKLEYLRDTILSEKASIENKLNSLKARKLTFKERFIGKLKISDYDF